MRCSTQERNDTKRSGAANRLQIRLDPVQTLTDKAQRGLQSLDPVEKVKDSCLLG